MNSFDEKFLENLKLTNELVHCPKRNKILIGN